MRRRAVRGPKTGISYSPSPLSKVIMCTVDRGEWRAGHLLIAYRRYPLTSFPQVGGANGKDACLS
jgi:hypothetical protein